MNALQLQQVLLEELNRLLRIERNTESVYEHEWHVKIAKIGLIEEIIEKTQSALKMQIETPVNMPYTFSSESELVLFLKNRLQEAMEKLEQLPKEQNLVLDRYCDNLVAISFLQGSIQAYIEATRGIQALNNGIELETDLKNKDIEF